MKPPTAWATTDAAVAAAEHWSTATLQCRSYGHNWAPLSARYVSRYRYYHAVMACVRCNAERHSELSDRGIVLGQWYVYPEHYLAAGIGRIGGDAKGALRLMAMGTTPTVRRAEAPHTLAARRALGVRTP